MKAEGFPREKRLIFKRDFQAVFSRGIKIKAHPFLQGRLLVRHGSTVSRLGLVVSRKIGNAVIRNRVKRRLREAFRKHEGKASRAVDVVLVARPGIQQCSLRELEHILVTEILDQKKS